MTNSKCHWSGMFLYARLVLDYLSANIFINGTQLRESVDALPKELSELYVPRSPLILFPWTVDIINKIDSYRVLVARILAPLDQNSTNHIKCILGWISYARRPLRRSELLSAVSFTSGDPNVELPAPQYIIDICRTLVEERRDTTLSFIHSSVKE